MLYHFTGFYAHEATLHCKQGKTTKAKGEAARKKKRLSRRAGEKGRETTTETERRKEKDLQNDGTSRTTEKESVIKLKTLPTDYHTFLVKSVLRIC